jgi:release factor family 3
LDLSVRQRYAGRETAPILAPFHGLAEDDRFWNQGLDGLAVFAASDLFKVYRLQRPVRELAVVAGSFHTKPLMRMLQSADRYHVLGINRQEARLYEGNRYVLDEVEPTAGVPQTVSDVVGTKVGEPERRTRVYGPGDPGGTTRHGTDIRQDETASESERFFRAVDSAVLEHYSRPSGMPLLLAALPEHHHLFRLVSRNPFLVAEAIDAYSGALSLDELRQRAWQAILPRYLERLSALVERFGSARANGLGSDDLADIGRAAAAGGISALLIEADRVIPGRFDPVSGAVEFAALGDPRVDDLLDDLAEQTLRTGGEVVIVPGERMPTDTGIAAVRRF